ncbi:MAG TPA: hypothetical protein VJK02_18200 [Anaerolineales bacterium]|nr:hypothetical protein [Anaerolineales bacterium]
MKHTLTTASKLFIIVTLLASAAGLAAAAADAGHEAGPHADGTPSVLYLPLIMNGAPLPDPVIPETTEVLTESTTQYLASVSGDGAEFTFTQTTPELDEVSSGDVIAGEATTNAPYGFLRKVTDVATTDDQVVVTTVDATLEDAIEAGWIQVTQALSPDDIQESVKMAGVLLDEGPRVQSGFNYDLANVVLYDDDGDPGTTNDQIVANGSIALELGFAFRLVMSGSQVRELSFRSNANETAQLQIESEVEFPLIQEEKEIARHYFSPIAFFVGQVPIVIVPVLTVNVGVDGSVHVGVSTDVTQQATLTAGLIYDEGTWSPVSVFSNEFQFNPPSLSADLNLKGYAGAELALLLYGVTGPHAEVTAYLELEADVLATPWWQLYGGLEVPVGIELQVFSHVIASYETTLIDYRLLIAQAETGSAGQIAFLRDDDPELETYEIYVMDADGTGVSRLTYTNGSVFHGPPIWSPDGTMIAFVSDVDGDEEIYVMNADGTGQTNLTNNSARDVSSAWSPDRTKMAFSSDRDGEWQIYVMDPDGTGQINLTNNPIWRDTGPVWSPDGTKIAFVSDRNGYSDIFVMNPDGTEQTNLTDNVWITDTAPVWSPDGTKIAFIRDDGTFETNDEIYVMNADGTGQTNLTNNSALDETPVWSPDRTKIAFGSYRDSGTTGGTEEIYAMNADGTGVVRLTNNSSRDSDPLWAPDGSKIAFVSGRDNNLEIYVMNPDGTAQTNLTSNPARDDMPSWRPQ